MRVDWTRSGPGSWAPLRTRTRPGGSVRGGCEPEPGHRVQVRFGFEREVERLTEMGGVAWRTEFDVAIGGGGGFHGDKGGDLVDDALMDQCCYLSTRLEQVHA